MPPAHPTTGEGGWELKTQNSKFKIGTGGGQLDAFGITIHRMM
jgi:hypothetical protein